MADEEQVVQAGNEALDAASEGMDQDEDDDDDDKLFQQLFEKDMRLQCRKDVKATFTTSDLVAIDQYNVDHVQGYLHHQYLSYLFGFAPPRT